MHLKKMIAALCILTTLAGAGAGCGNPAKAQAGTISQSTAGATVETKKAVSGTENLAPESEKTVRPKYIFLFIGDGMSYPQIESTNYYLAALETGTSMGNSKEKTILSKPEDALSFLDFPVVGSAQTYDSTSFCPDSASTATSISTGKKTYSGTVCLWL